MSPYPFACVTGGERGLAIAIDPALPVVHRFSFSRLAGLGAEFDIALSSLQAESPGVCSLVVFTYEIDPAWGFRSAAARYYTIFPESFRRRVPVEGIWMPFTPVNEVEAWEDFGFALHETHRGTRTTYQGVSTPVEAVDRKLGVLSFQYTEPWDIQVPVDSGPLSYGDAARVADAHGSSGGQIRRSAAFDEHDQWLTRVISAPWFPTGRAVSYTTSAAPDRSATSRFSAVRREEIEAAIAHGFDGIYFDSLEFFWHHDLNYREEHIAAARGPLTFSVTAAHPRPCLWNYSTQYAMLEEICTDLHDRGKLSMGNGFSWLSFAVSQLDILGTEFSWYMDPAEKARISAFRRTACGQKPVVLLLNQGLYSEDFTRAPYDGYRKYFEESLFYGFYPSFFSADASNDPYWKNPSAYNLGRPFFRRYVPIVRLLNSQGWQPVTLARGSGVSIERFDAPGDSLALFTVRAEGGAAPRILEVVLDPALLPDGTNPLVEEILQGRSVTASGDRAFRLVGVPGTTYVLRCVFVEDS
jgi:hypothetical protein